LPLIVFFIISQESVREFGAKLRRKLERVSAVRGHARALKTGDT
jgi:hypothetical protein